MLTEDKLRMTYDLPSKAEVDQFMDLLEKGKVAPIGEVRTWSGQQYVKHADGWVHVHPITGKVTVLPTSGPVKKLDGNDEHKAHFEKHVSLTKDDQSEDKSPSDRKSEIYDGVMKRAGFGAKSIEVGDTFIDKYTKQKSKVLSINPEQGTLDHQEIGSGVKFTAKISDVNKLRIIKNPTNEPDHSELFVGPKTDKVKEAQEKLDMVKQEQAQADVSLDKIKSQVPAVLQNLAKLGLKIEGKIKDTVIRPSESMFEESKGKPAYARIEFTATSVDGKFKFVADKGYNARGASLNRDQLMAKKDKIEKLLVEATGLNVSINQYSLEENKEGTTNRVMFSMQNK